MMPLLGILAYLGLKGTARVVDALDNEDMKRRTTNIDELGNVVQGGNVGQQYYNGEKTYTWTEYDRLGNPHNLTIGINSRKVYADSFKLKAIREKPKDEENRRQAIANGQLAYNKWYSKFNRRCLTEISTGKIISCLAIYYDDDGNKVYRKWYVPKNLTSNKDYNKTETGDFGIVISKEEYDKLNINKGYGSYSTLPTDDKVERILAKW